MHVKVLGIWLTSLSLELSKTLLAEFATSFARPRHGLDTLRTPSTRHRARQWRNDIGRHGDALGMRLHRILAIKHAGVDQ